MDAFISQLDIKYKQYHENLLDRENPDWESNVFESAYEYFYLTEKQPKIQEIVESDKQGVEKKKQEILRNNDSLDVQNELIKRITANSLSFYYCEILRDAYSPMAKYKNSVSLLSPKEVFGETILFRERFLDILFLMVKNFAQFFGMTIRKDIDMHLALQKVIYSFRQKKYSIYMERVHTLLVPQLLEIHAQSREMKHTKVDLIIDSKKGIYRKNNDKLSYGVGKNSKRFKIIRYLLTKDDCSISELADITHQTNHVTMKSISEINRLFREKTLLSDNLICHNDTVGYFFNKDTFEPEIKE